VYFYFAQHVDEENAYLCGYLKIKGLTEEFPTLTTFFDGEIISKKYPFLTRKWDADEDVDKKHWVSCDLQKCKWVVDLLERSVSRSLKYCDTGLSINVVNLWIT